MVDVVDEKIEEGEVLLLCPPGKLLMITQLLDSLGTVVLGFEPGRENFGIEPDLGGDVKDQLDDASFRVGAQPDTVGARYAHQQVGEAGGEAIVFDKRLLLTLDQGSEEKNSLFDDPLAEGACRDFGDRDIDLLRRGKRYAWMG